jgi:hypothetical protein
MVHDSMLNLDHRLEAYTQLINSQVQTNTAIFGQVTVDIVMKLVAVLEIHPVYTCIDWTIACTSCSHKQG